MIAPAIQPKIDAENIPLEQLRSNPKVSNQDKLHVAAEQFEGLLLRHMLKHATDPVIKSGLTENDATSSIYRDMVRENLADAISRSGSIGLASSLESQLSRQLQVGAARPAPASNPVSEKKSAAETAPPHSDDTCSFPAKSHDPVRQASPLTR